MRRFLLAAAVMLLALPAAAQQPDAQSFTAAQRREIVQIIRDALKSDPTILREAIATLHAQDEAQDAADTKSRLAAKQQALTATAGDPVAGNPAGDVTLVEFYDPRCPYCRRMVPAIKDMLNRDHGIRLVYKDIPVLGPASVLESRAILAAARQGAYQKMQDALMSNPAEPTEAMIRQTARGLGLDPARLISDMNGADVTHQIDSNLSLANDLKVDGTPMFVIGDSLIPGAVDEQALLAAVAAMRKHS
jgi:protein-disulfide isomerase